MASLFLFYFLLLFGLGLGLLLNHVPLLVGVALGFALKFMAEVLVMWRGLRLFNACSLMKWFLPAEIVHVPATVGAVLFGVFGKVAWKN